MLIYEIRIGYCAIKKQGNTLKKEIYHTELVESKLLSSVRKRATNKLKTLEEMKRFREQYLQWENWSEPVEWKKNHWMTQKKSETIEHPTSSTLCSLKRGSIPNGAPSHPPIQGICQITWETLQMTFDDIQNFNFKEEQPSSTSAALNRDGTSFEVGEAPSSKEVPS